MPRPPRRAPSPEDTPTLELAVSPRGTFFLDTRGTSAGDTAQASAQQLAGAFARSPAAGLLYLATGCLGLDLPASLAFGRALGRAFLTALCHAPDLEARRPQVEIPLPSRDLEQLAASAPPMLGAEYVSPEALALAWSSLEAEVARELSAFAGSVEDYLREKSPAWSMMGRVCFHLAENKRDEQKPFAFLATYASKVSAQGRVQHAPLGRAASEYAGAGKRAELLRLLAPVQRAAGRSEVVRKLVDSGEVFHPLAWTPDEALAFLRETASLEESGVVVRVPDWWHARRASGPAVHVTLGSNPSGQLDANALLDFNVALSMDGEPLSPDEWRALLAGTDGLRLVKGRWVEVDRKRLQEVLEHWKRVEREAENGVSFLQGMRMLAGLGKGGAADVDLPDADAAWCRVEAGPWLDEVLRDLRRPEGSREADPGTALRGTLRPYQRAGVAWLWLLWKLGLGACLADDMGLGKTIQVLSLLLLFQRHGVAGPHLLIVPASLLGNWSAEMKRFAPSLRALCAHPSIMDAGAVASLGPRCLEGVDVVMTTYGAAMRGPWMAEVDWGLVVLDEAQAIKNPSAKQTRAVKALRARSRLAMTGTPIENRLGDLWSLFDFLCPGLLGSAAAFKASTKRLEADSRGYAKLRELVRPYLLRRMKSDKAIAPDLPDKTEMLTYCSLTRAQAALYREAVDDLARSLDEVEGMKRRGTVLASLLRFKQICNHPSQWLGDGAYDPKDSGKLARLRELCEPIAARQDKVLVFTQFREMTGPLAAFLAGVFGRPGLVLSGETKIGARAALVADFQRDGGPPFFVLSVKAGGTGLNLTAASHVIHFDRWWNPAVENQATDRAHRIGQKRNVLVHKFVCKGTVEEKIEALIASKRGLSDEILAGGGEAWITEMKSDDLLRLVSLDLRDALDEE